MTMTLDTNHQRFPLNFAPMSSYSAPHHPGPHFTNPWASSSSPSSAVGPHAGSQSMYLTSPNAMGHAGPLGLDMIKPESAVSSRAPSTASSRASIASYGSIPVTTSSAGSPISLPDHLYPRQQQQQQQHQQQQHQHQQQDLLSLPQDLLSMSRLPHHTTSAAFADPIYATASPIPSSAYATSPTTYDHLGYPAPPLPPPMRSTFGLAPDHHHNHHNQHQHQHHHQQPDDRRYSQSSSVPSPLLGSQRAGGGPMADEDRKDFAQALEASQGIMSLSQDTPRPLYGSRIRGGPADSYGFPSAHSASSSVSSAGFSGYYAASVDSSVSDYSTAGSDMESAAASRILPRPQALLAGNEGGGQGLSSHLTGPSSSHHAPTFGGSSGRPPVPQSMMSQFSAKVASSSQKKHKCKVCDKRFTRPSSLQTHMYSHTGEKPFSCEVEGCGRHFSVVSNLRRHHKVHKAQGSSDAGSDGHHSD